MLFVDKIKGIFNKPQSYINSGQRVNERLSKVETFLSDFPVQFTLGHVIECITNRDSILSLNKDSNINAIKALKHTGKSIDSKNIETLQSATYYPLMRGIVDAPTQGDPVLLCEFAGRKYYIGPLNTVNSPNFNPDVLMKADNVDEYSSGRSDMTLDILKSLNINPHFKFSNKVKRLYKPISYMDYANENDASPFNRGVGDLMLEGRFGNSIRIGSRSGRPNIFISNGRNMGNRIESFNDGCLITMTSVGALKHHFSFPKQKIEQDLNLPSNVENKSDRKIEFNNEYDKSQILVLSNRLIFASRSDNILLSSYFDVEIGSGRNLKIYTKDDTIIKSKNIYLGEGASEPLVMGNELVKVIQEMIDAIGKCNVGMTQPLGFTSTIDGTTVPGGGSLGSGWIELTKLKKNLDRIKSKYAFVQEKAGK